MKRNLFNQLGGFPFAQDTLEWQQDRTKQILQAIAEMGVPAGSTAPVILSGVHKSTGPDAYSAGWIYLNGDVIYFAGGNIPGSPDLSKVYVQEYKTAVVFEDTTSKEVYIDNAFVYGVAPVGVTQYEIATMKRFHEQFGKQAAADAWSSISVTASVGTAATPANAAGDLFYKKVHVPDGVQVRADLTITEAQRIVGNPRYDLMCQLPVGFRPSQIRHFKASVYYHNTAYILDVSEKDYIKDVNCIINTSGQISIGWIEPIAGVTTYTISFNEFIPLY
ncbi:hypothetical protein CAP35_13690 [Chitinophagaceae bacterium IBVUCB1]|nr:hypothetical protein CAP35_13690 [Chitinophagaceae bacterium IBVUCB1]